MDREDILQSITDFLEKLENQGKSFTGVLYTGTSLIISSKEKILNTAEELGVAIDPEMEEQDTLFIVLEDDDEDEPQGYLQ